MRGQMENNVNCKEMRFVIGYRIDVDDVSPATAPEILPDCLYQRWYFPEEERMIQHDNVSISLGYETKVINPVGEPSNTM